MSNLPTSLMATQEFEPFPKIARLQRECIITEKIDGTNAQIFITPGSLKTHPQAIDSWFDEATQTDYVMLAGSRTRWLTLGQDNYGFYSWAHDHFQELKKLGPGRHFGEWWGSGIQRGYGLTKGDKRFSLFNISRWCLNGSTPARIPSPDPTSTKCQDVLPACVGLVPVLHKGIFSTLDCQMARDQLKLYGSRAVNGYMNPEGIVIYHTAAGIGFKATLKGDGLPKSLTS